MELSNSQQSRREAYIRSDQRKEGRLKYCMRESCKLRSHTTLRRSNKDQYTSVAKLKDNNLSASRVATRENHLRLIPPKLSRNLKPQQLATGILW